VGPATRASRWSSCSGGATSASCGSHTLRYATGLAHSAARKALGKAGLAGRDVDLVITVSCTGYIVPSLEWHLASLLGFRPDVIGSRSPSSAAQRGHASRAHVTHWRLRDTVGRVRRSGRLELPRRKAGWTTSTRLPSCIGIGQEPPCSGPDAGPA